MTSDDSMNVSVVLRTAADDIDAHNAADRDVIFTSKWFRDLADRVDDEMVELPKDRDGKPIHPGDIEYLIASGDICEIYTIEIDSGGAYVTAMVGGGTDHADVVDLDPCKLTHTMPDSFERIADDIETVAPINDEDDERLRHELADRIRRLADSADDSCEKLADLAERIRRLAKEDDK